MFIVFSFLLFEGRHFIHVMNVMEAGRRIILAAKYITLYMTVTFGIKILSNS